MKFRVVKVEDTEEMRDIHKLAFSADPWPGDDHEFWVVYDSHGAVAAFASAVLLTSGTAYLSRAAVTMKYRGAGLHERLINVRLKWAKKEGCYIAVTYIRKFNYASMMNLLKTGFRFVQRHNVPSSWGNFHGMWRHVNDNGGGEPTRGIIDLMDEPTEG